MEAAIGILGIVLGIILNQLLTQRNRIDSYSQNIFERRVLLHEELYGLVHHADDIISELIRNEDTEKDDAEMIIGTEILKIAGFCDRNRMYIDKYLGAQATAFPMPISEYFETNDETEKEDFISKYRHSTLETKELILKESGDEIDQLYKAIGKAKGAGC